MKGVAKNAQPWIKDHPNFNLWTFKTVPKVSLVKLPSENDKESHAYPLQINTDIYTSLFAIFCQKGSAILHICSNVCQSLLPAREMECQIYCWESSLEMTQAGIKHAAEIAAADDLQVEIEVSWFSLFIVNVILDFGEYQKLF